jgi:serine phosphatase RsbU (regulator of sigma subunit)
VEGEHLVLAGAAHVDPDVERKLRESPRPVPMRHAAGVCRVLQEGRPELCRVRGEPCLPTLENMAEFFRPGGRDSASCICLPLCARGKNFGALTLAYNGSGRSYGEADLAIAERLAQSISLALDNARLYRSQREIADTLQRSLLPPQIPDIPGYRIAAWFRPLGESVQMGGDFYDVYPAGRGWCVVVGDVAGKGPAAAAVTSVVRYALHSITARETAPVEVLERLNEVLLRRNEPQRFCSMVYVYLESCEGDARLRIGNAGHPPLLIGRDDGTVEMVGNHGMLLGVAEKTEFEEAVAVIRPGDTVLMYTDGLSEAERDGHLLGDDGVARLLSALRGRGAEEVLRGLERALLEYQGTPPRDDVAVLVVQPMGEERT